MFALSVALFSLIALIRAEPEPPKLTYLYEVDLEIPPPIDIGNGPFGSRGILSITGGNFTGPLLNGTVGSGLDWGLTDASGTFSPDAIYVLQTSDGANIMVTEKGHAPNVLIQFETGAEDYSWMNSIVGYATGAPTDTGVHLDVWQVGTGGPPADGPADEE